MEEEVVISSWQQSDFPKDENGSFSKAIKGMSKENVDMNTWLTDQDRKLGRSNELETEEDDIMLDDDILSRLIEGDLKSNEELESFSSSKRPKPMPRQDKGFSDTGSPSNKDFEDKLFSSGKDSAVKLFSGTNDSADKLFSRGKQKETNNDTIISPRPVPRPRSKPASKEKASLESSNQGLHFFNKTSHSETSADKLFDSLGKSCKSVSFVEIDAGKDSTDKKLHQKIESTEKSSNGERTPPRKAPRNKQNSNSPGRRKSSDESELVEKNFQRTSEHKQRPQPLRRHRKDHTMESINSSLTGHYTGSARTSDGMEFFDSRLMSNDGSVEHLRKSSRDVTLESGTARRLKEKMYSDTMHESDRGRSTPRKQSMEHDTNGADSVWYSKGKQEKVGNSEKKRSKKGNITDMFEEHFPASREFVLDGNEQRTDEHNRRYSGKDNKTRSPMKAQRGLNEMTKSPDIYPFKYESRDSPQIGTLSRRNTGTLSSQRSSSLTDLDSWKTTQFDDYHDEEGLQSSRSGFSSSQGIRDAVYAEWLEKKQQKLKEAVRKKVEEKKKEAEKTKEKEEKEFLAQKAFEAWSSSKEAVIKTTIKKKKEIKEKELDTKREKILKKQDAKKFFESWKSKKDEVLKESYKDKKAREREAKQKKIEDHKEKIEIAKKAFDKWKSNKDELLKEAARSARQSEKLKTKYEKEAEMEKRQECEKTFQQFLRKKGTGRRAPPSPSLTQRAWCPGGITKGVSLIPEKVQPVIAPPALNRSRSFSGPTRTMTSFNASKRLSRGW